MQETTILGSLGSSYCLCATRLRGLRLRGWGAAPVMQLWEVPRLTGDAKEGDALSALALGVSEGLQ